MPSFHARAILVMLILAGFSARAGKLTFRVDTDKPGAIYAPGEPMTFRVQLLEDGKPVVGRDLRWVRTGDDQKTAKGSVVSQAEPVTITAAINQPGFVYLVITPYGEDGKPNKKAAFKGGAGVQPETLLSIPEPEDFDAFWTAQKAKLATVPIKAELEPVKLKSPALVGFDVKVDCAGGMPVSGYFVKPKDAAPKSLPGIVSFHGYGVSGARKQENSAAKGMLALDINAHGIVNGKPGAFYKNLRATDLKGYGFKGNEDPEKSYFLGMTMRVMRALEFIKAQPEWDGKNLIVFGGSQGGFQALVAAGLDPQVTFCVASKPWLCDLGGVTLKRLKGWRPGYTPALRYFDPVNHAKRIKAQTVVDIGLGDYVCPPSGVCAMMNGIAAPKKLILVQGATHGFAPPKSPNVWRDYSAHLNQLTGK